MMYSKCMQSKKSELVHVVDENKGVLLSILRLTELKLSGIAIEMPSGYTVKQPCRLALSLSRLSFNLDFRFILLVD